MCKVSKYGVFSGPYFPLFGLNTEIYSVNLRIQSKSGKHGPESSPYLDTFHAVSYSLIHNWYFYKLIKVLLLSSLTVRRIWKNSFGIIWRNVPCQLHQKNPTSKMKDKRLEQLKALKDNEFIDNELCYYGQPVSRSIKITCFTVSSSSST